MRRSFTLIGLLLVLLVWPAVAGAAKVSFWSNYSESEFAVFESQVVPLFVEKHPDIELEAVRLGYDELREKFVTGVAAGAGPDVARVDIIWTPGFAESGLLQRLDTYPEFNEMTEDIFPAPLATNFYKGHYYGMPLDTNTQVYIYNKALFAQAGVAKPETLEEFHEVTRRLTLRQDGEVDQWGYDMGGPWNWFLLPWIWSAGGRVVNPEITQASGYLDSPETCQVISMIAEWAAEGILAPNMRREGFDSWGSFARGQVAARQDGPWFVQWLLSSDPDFDLGLGLMPHAPGVSSSSVVGGENIVMSADAGDKQAAWTFIKFMLSPEVQSIMAAAGQMPVVYAAVDNPTFEEKEFYQWYVQQLMTARPRPPHPKYSEMEKIMQDAFWLVISGEQGAQGALGQAAELIDSLLSEAE